MSTCPKCELGQLEGPRYRTILDEQYAGTCSTTEYLEYTCSKCGYRHKENTRDHKPIMTNAELEKFLARKK